MAKGFQARKWAQGGAGSPFKPADAAWEPFAINPPGWGGSHRDAASGSSTLGPTKAFVAFLASLGWRPSAAPTHDLDTLHGRRG
jgi:hypothetical protein